MRDDLGRFVKGYKHSENWYKKMVGRISWNKGKANPNVYLHLGNYAKKGAVPWNKGTKGRMIAWNKGRYGYTTSKKGYKVPEEVRKKISMSLRKINKWDGFIKSKDYLERRKFREIMQKQVFERDDYTCQLCGSNTDLQVDHIQKWSKYVELRFDINNCRTLCVRCHYKITFGREMPSFVNGWGHNLLRKEVQNL